MRIVKEEDLKNPLVSPEPEQIPLAVGVTQYKLRLPDMVKGEFLGNCLSPKKLLVRKIVNYRDKNYKVLAISYAKYQGGDNIVTLKPLD